MDRNFNIKTESKNDPTPVVGSVIGDKNTLIFHQSGTGDQFTIFYTNNNGKVYKLEEGASKIVIGGNNLLDNTEFPKFSPNNTGQGFYEEKEEHGLGKYIKMYPEADKLLSLYYPQPLPEENAFSGNFSRSIMVRHQHTSPITIWGHSVPPNTWYRLRDEGYREVNNYIQIVFTDESLKGVSIDVKKLKVEYGNKCTDWSPSIKDLKNTAGGLTEVPTLNEVLAKGSDLGDHILTGKFNYDQTKNSHRLNVLMTEDSGLEITNSNPGSSCTTTINFLGLHTTGRITGNRINPDSAEEYVQKHYVDSKLSGGGSGSVDLSNYEGDVHFHKTVGNENYSFNVSLNGGVSYRNENTDRHTSNTYNNDFRSFSYHFTSHEGNYSITYNEQGLILENDHLIKNNKYIKPTEDEQYVQKKYVDGVLNSMNKNEIASFQAKLTNSKFISNDSFLDDTLNSKEYKTLSIQGDFNMVYKDICYRNSLTSGSDNAELILEKRGLNELRISSSSTNALVKITYSGSGITNKMAFYTKSYSTKTDLLTKGFNLGDRSDIDQINIEDATSIFDNIHTIPVQYKSDSMIDKTLVVLLDKSDKLDVENNFNEKYLSFTYQNSMIQITDEPKLLFITDVTLTKSNFKIFDDTTQVDYDIEEVINRDSFDHDDNHGFKYALGHIYSLTLKGPVRTKLILQHEG